VKKQAKVDRRVGKELCTWWDLKSPVCWADDRGQVGMLEPWKSLLALKNRLITNTMMSQMRKQDFFFS
jgi:hypothetical protein